MEKKKKGKGAYMKPMEIYAIKEYEKNGEKKSVWIRIGTAFENKDGSLNLFFDTFPVNKDIKTIQVREKTEKPKEGKGAHGFTAQELQPDSDIPAW